MPSALHEGYADILRSRPRITARLVASITGDTSLHREKPRLERSTFEQSRPPEYSADLVLAFGDPKPVLAAVIEVQLRRAPKKLLTWPAYSAMLRARLGCPVIVVVFCVSDATARWASQVVRMGPGANVFQACAVGPAELDAVKAPRSAEVAVVKSLSMSRTDRALDAAWKAVNALQRASHLDEETVRYYYDLVANSLSKAARKALEAKMMQADPSFDTPLVRKLLKLGRKEGRNEGREEGREEGRAEGQARALLAVFEARGIPVSAAQRAKVTACRDPERLERWIAAAVNCTSCTEALADRPRAKARRTARKSR